MLRIKLVFVFQGPASAAGPFFYPESIIKKIFAAVMEAPVNGTSQTNQTCYLLVKLIISIVGTTLHEDDWTNGDESLDLECEVGEFFYFKYRGW